MVKFYCKECGESFDDNASMNAHMVAVHQEFDPPGFSSDAFSSTMDIADKDEEEVLRSIPTKKSFFGRVRGWLGGKRDWLKGKLDARAAAKAAAPKKPQTPEQELKDLLNIGMIIIAAIGGAFVYFGKIVGIEGTALYALIGFISLIGIGIVWSFLGRELTGKIFKRIGMIGMLLIVIPSLAFNAQAVANAVNDATGTDIQLPGLAEITGFHGASSIFDIAGCLLSDPTKCAASLENETSDNAIQLSTEGVTIESFEIDPTLIRPGNFFRIGTTVKNNGKVGSTVIVENNGSPQFNSNVSAPGKIDQAERSCSDSPETNDWNICTFHFRPSEEKDVYWDYSTEPNLPTMSFPHNVRLYYNYTVESVLPVEAYPTFRTRSPKGSVASEGSAKLSLGVGGQPLEKGENRILSMIVTNNQKGIVFGYPLVGPIKITAAIPNTVFNLTDYDPNTSCFVTVKDATKHPLADCVPANPLTKCISITVPSYNITGNEKLTISCKVNVRDDLSGKVSADVRGVLQYWYEEKSDRKSIQIKP